jgi:hypothetical protein
VFAAHCPASHWSVDHTAIVFILLAFIGLFLFAAVECCCVISNIPSVLFSFRDADVATTPFLLQPCSPLTCVVVYPCRVFTLLYFQSSFV